MAQSIKKYSLLPLMTIMFVNSFIDLGHKITLQNTIFKVYDGSTQIILTAIINGLILLPFIFFYRPAGMLSDKIAKARVIRFSSVFALIISMLICLSYYKGWFWFSFAMTFILAIQSALVSPAKYGLIRELVSNSKLTSVNAKAQTLVTLGIVSGIFIFTVLFEFSYKDISIITEHTILQTLYPLGFLLVLMSMIELVAAWKLPLIPPLVFERSIEKEGWHHLKKDSLIWPVTIGLCVFWSVGQMLLADYPSFAEDQMGIENTIVIQSLMLTLGIGIMFGSMVTSWLSKQYINLALIPVSGLIIIANLFILPLITNIYLAFILFASIGFFGGLFVVPLNTVIQFCTEKNHLGQNLASVNLIKNIAMTICLLLTIAGSAASLDSRHILYLIAFISSVGIGYLLLKTPQTLIAFKEKYISNKTKMKIIGFDRLSGTGNTLFICSENTAKVLTILQPYYPRKIQLSTCHSPFKEPVVLLSPLENASKLIEKIGFEQLITVTILETDRDTCLTLQLKHKLTTEGKV